MNGYGTMFEAMEKRIAELEAAKKILTADCEKYRNAAQGWSRTAERRWQKLQAISQILGTQGDPEVEAAAVVADKERIESENAALREAAERIFEIKKLLEETSGHGPFSCARCNGLMDSLRQLIAENAHQAWRRTRMRSEIRGGAG